MPKAAKTYRVIDRGMPKDVHMLRTADKAWYAGDTLTSDDLAADDIKEMLSLGVIEVANG